MKRTRSSFLQLTCDTDIIASGDNVGGLLTFPAPRDTTGFILESVTIHDQAKQSANYDLVIFNSLPAGTFTTNAAQTLTDATLKLVAASVAITTHAVFVNNSVSRSAGNLGIPLQSIPNVLGDKVIYGILIGRATPTQVATDDISIRLALREA